MLDERNERYSLGVGKAKPVTLEIGQAPSRALRGQLSQPNLLESFRTKITHHLSLHRPCVDVCMCLCVDVCMRVCVEVCMCVYVDVV